MLMACEHALKWEICETKLQRSARLPFARKYFFSSVPHVLARTPVRRIKYLLINVFEIQVKLLLVVITASDIAQSSHFTGNVTGTRKGQV